MKKAIFGGTFDPIHNGHMNIAYEALYKLKLDKIIFVPSGNPPHKDKRNVTDGRIRYDIVNAAINGEKYFEIDDYEIVRDEASYTYKTLEHFKKIESNTDWYFIVGADSLLEIEKWKNVKGLLKLCNLIVFNRPGYDIQDVKQQKKYIEKKYKTKIMFLNVPLVDISSTNIKKKILKGENIKYLIPNEVFHKILELKLYSRGCGEMVNETEIYQYIRGALRPKRYTHTLGVLETAESLCEIYGCDKYKTRIAALLHDCAKNMSDDELIKITKENNLIEVDETIKHSPMLLHGFVGAYIAGEKFNINDVDIINSIKYHTTGRPNMSILEKIIYVSDGIEPSRKFEGVDDIREVAIKDLDKALLMMYNQTIKYIISKNQLLYPKTIEARNYLLIK
ncbi:hypothetical protein UT300019_02280 [Clostridium sp. CTA-19]